MTDAPLTPPPSPPPAWPDAPPPAPVPPPRSHAALADAAARAALSNARRDMIDYLRLRRKPD